MNKELMNSIIVEKISKLLNCSIEDTNNNKNIIKWARVLICFNPEHPKENLHNHLSSKDNMIKSSNNSYKISNLSTKSLIYYSDLNIEKAKNLNPNTRRINAPESYKFIMCRIQLIINISKMNHLSRKEKGLAYHILRTSHDFTSEENNFLKSLIKESRNDI
jgi:hypothetical protein